ncbi:hypothetical protein EI534_36785, partial [Pseudomonas frederiksbergensis]|nr:hypothetical protein [Pseudomonas frederiksbergensis]
MPKRLEQWPRQPRIVTVVFDPQAEANALKSTLDSLASQSYPAHQVWVLGAQEQLPDEAGVERIQLRGSGFEQLNARIAKAETADWVFLLQA